MPAPPWTDVVIHYVFPTVGGLAGLLLSATPLRSVREVERIGKGLGTFNPLPACVFLVNCFLWLAYGAAIKDPFVYLANAPAVLVSLHIILRTYPFANTPTRRQMERVLALGMALVLAVGVLYVFLAPALAMQINGALASLVNVLLYASPLSSLGRVLRTKDASSILLPWTFTALGCSVTWAVYGLATMQIPVVVPHAFGFVLNVIQLVLRLVFPARRHRANSSASSIGERAGGGSVAMTSMKKKKKQQQQGGKKKKVPAALLAGIRRRSDEENNYHRAPRHRHRSNSSGSESDSASDSASSSDDDEEEEKVERGLRKEVFPNKNRNEGKVRDVEEEMEQRSNTQSGRRRHSKSEDGTLSRRRSALQIDGDCLVEDAALYSSNDSAGPPQTMVVVVDGEDGLGLELATTRCASVSTSPVSSRALNQQEVEERKRGSTGRGQAQVPRIHRVSSQTPLCLYESPGSSDDERDRDERDVERGEIVDF